MYFNSLFIVEKDFQKHLQNFFYWPQTYERWCTSYRFEVASLGLVFIHMTSVGTWRKSEVRYDY